MAAISVNWSERATDELYETLDYYTARNKSKVYSTKLHKEIQTVLKNLDFSIALPQNTSKPNIFYFTHKHISVFFSYQLNTIFVKSVSDDRRNPLTTEMILKNID